MSECRITTFTGKAFRPLDPKPEDIDLADIAHALSLKCRWGGHCPSFFSVAQHSCIVARALLDEGRGGDVALWGLLHDAAEAYWPDVPRQVKFAVPEFAHRELAILQAVTSYFALPWPVPKSVHEMDGRVLVTEARELFDPTPNLGLFFEPLDRGITPIAPEVAERQFLLAYETLTAKDDGDE